MPAVPNKGDLVWINLNPKTGHEQSGHRPAIVLSPKEFNQITGLATICPITNTVKGWGFEVPLPSGLAFSGAILTDHLKNVDWRARDIKVQEQAPSELVQTCIDFINTYLFNDDK